jgi:glycosyltransferase involved in cell wall biosynthesis
MPLVSVIMNVRNGALFVREALDSVLSQTFADWELIVWDDCSTDNSAQIVGQYSDQRIRYWLSPEDTPLGKARDSAIRQARGQWLAFLDQDDVWLPGKLEKQMAMAESGVGIVYGRTVMFDARRGNRRDYDYAHEFTALPEGNIFTQLFASACFIAMSSAVLRRSAVEEIGRIPEAIEVAPDYYLYLAVAHRYPARAVQEVICRYRLHPGSMSRSHRLRLHLEPLLLIDQWAGWLDPKLVAYRRMTYSSALAVEEMRSRKTFRAGIARLWSQGSLLWSLTRPFMHAGRALRRKVRRPYWLATELASGRD